MDIQTASMGPPTNDSSATKSQLEGTGYGHFGNPGKMAPWPYLYIPDWSSPYAKSVCKVSGRVFAIYAWRLTVCIIVFELAAASGAGIEVFSNSFVKWLIAAILLFVIGKPLQHQRLLERLRRPVVLARIKGINSFSQARQRGLELEELEKDYDSMGALTFAKLENLLATSTSEEAIRASVQKLNEAKKLNPIIDRKLQEIEATLARALAERPRQEAEEARRAKNLAEEEERNWERVYLETIAIIDAKFDEVGHILASEFNKKVKRNVYGQEVEDKSEEAMAVFLDTLKVPYSDMAVIKARIFQFYPYVSEKVKEYNVTREPIATEMTGIDFEHHVASELRKFGWETEVTKASGDQGIDVIATRGRFKVGIQCKYFKGSVPNTAIQQAYTGKSHYNLQGAAVVTTGTFTKSALEVATSTGVVAISHYLLSELHQRFGLN